MKEYESIDSAIRELFGDVTVVDRQRVHGGDINDACALTLSDRKCVFIKQNAIRNKDFFRAEIAGIEAIAATGTIGTPKLLAWGEDRPTQTAFLMMEYLESAPRRSDAFEILGVELANLHRAKLPLSWFDPTREHAPDEEREKARFGFSADNYIGAGYQENTFCDSFIEFFRDHRLRPQMERARSRMGASLTSDCEKLLAKLDRYLIEPECPSLLHGDLWGGNIFTGPDGKEWLIDPAVYIGHREADLAMTELFGGFSRSFYASYREAWPLQPGYEDRRDLYNLYHMLNHLNLFGGGYLSSVSGIVRRYV